MNQNSRHKIGNNGKKWQKIRFIKKLGMVLQKSEIVNTFYLPRYILYNAQKIRIFQENCPEFSTQGQIAMWSNVMKFFRSCLFFFHKILKREYYYHYTFKGQFLGPPLTSQYVLIAGSLIFSESCFTLRSST